MTNSRPDLPFYKNSYEPIPERVDDLLSRMSLTQKLAQLNCTALRFIDVEHSEAVLGQGMGHFALSIASGETIEQNAAMVEAAQRFLVEQTELGIPALVHVEALAGAMLVGATNFPGAIALGATWDPEGVEAMGGVIARQLGALGVRHVLSPVMDVARDIRWGRIGETYGEDATLAARMSVAFVKGVQTDDLAGGVATTGKHFLGYAATEGAMNTTLERIGPRELREVYARPFTAAIREAGLATIMNSYSTLDGIPIVASSEILTDLLRGELGFTGMTISDYSAINKLVVPLHITDDYTEAGILALQAGMDVEAPEIAAYGPGLLEAVETGRLPVEALDRAVRRVLELKFRLGLLERPYPDREAIARAFAQPKDDELSYRLAHEAIVLLENRDRLLPLSTELRKVAVIGPNANQLRTLFSGYSFPAALEVNTGSGAGQPGHDMNPAARDAPSVEPGDDVGLEARLARLYPRAVTPRDAIVAKLTGATVAYAQGCGLHGDDRSGFDEAVRQAEQADVVILFVGDQEGWNPENCTIGEGFDNSTIGLPGVQEDLVQAIYATGTPVVLVNVSPRPLSSPWIAEHIPAIVQAWHPGQAGGRAIADVLFGDYNPGGKLPMSAARSTGQLPIYYAHQRGSGYEGRAFWPWSAPTGYTDGSDGPLYPFGHGLSYTQFAYADLAVEQAEIPADGTVSLSCIVSNTGAQDGDEVVQLYIADRLASVARPVKELAGFRRIRLAAGQSRKVRFTVQLSQLAFLDRTMRWVVEPGEMDVLIGTSSQDIRLRGSFTVVGETREVGAERAFYATSRDQVLEDYVPRLGASAVSPAFSLDSTVADLLANEAARAILERHVPGLFDNPAMLERVQSATMRKVGTISIPAVEPKRLRAVAADLAALKD
jgi:beta-glucosidase